MQKEESTYTSFVLLSRVRHCNFFFFWKVEKVSLGYYLAYFFVEICTTQFVFNEDIKRISQPTIHFLRVPANEIVLFLGITYTFNKYCEKTVIAWDTFVLNQINFVIFVLGNNIQEIIIIEEKT